MPLKSADEYTACTYYVLVSKSLNYGQHIKNLYQKDTYLFHYNCEIALQYLTKSGIEMSQQINLKQRVTSVHIIN